MDKTQKTLLMKDLHLGAKTWKKSKGFCREKWKLSADFSWIILNAELHFGLLRFPNERYEPLCEGQNEDLPRKFGIIVCEKHWIGNLHTFFWMCAECGALDLRFFLFEILSLCEDQNGPGSFLSQRCSLDWKSCIQNELTWLDVNAES